MKTGPSHRWFHTLVVTGAAITACGGSTNDSAADASADSSADTSLPDAMPTDALPDADAGGSIIITSDVMTGDPTDVRNDPRCCTITN